MSARLDPSPASAASAVRVGLVVVGACELGGGGGAERYFADLFLAWQEQPQPGCELVLITDEPTRRALAAVGRALPLSEWVTQLPRARGWGALRQCAALLRVLYRERLSVVHLSMMLPRHLPWLWLLWVAPRLRRPRVTVNVNDARLAHNLLAADGAGDGPAGLERWTYDAYFASAPVDAVMSWYQRFVDRFAARYRRRPRLHAARYCFVDTARYRPAPRKQPWVVFAGRLVTGKRPLLFVDTIAALHRQTPAIAHGYRFFIFGRGPLESAVHDRIEELGLREAITIGDPAKLEATLAQSSVFVSTQDYENFTSLAMLEAMACGNAVVARDVGQTRCFVRPGANGLLASEDSAAALATQLALCLGEPQRLAAWGAESRRIAEEEHCAANVLREFAQFWTAIAHEQPAP